MITFDSEDFQKQLEAISKKFRNQMEEGVKSFIYKTADIFIQSTPYGDDVLNADYYDDRQSWHLPIVLKPIQGLSKGSWITTMDEPMFIQNTGRYDNPMGGKAQAMNYLMVDSYMLGDTYFITNATPYIEDLERGYSSQAPEGIYKLSLNKLQRLYGLNVAKILNKPRSKYG